MKYSEYQPRPDLLKDRIILITGAGDGIGRAAALSYALHGATVVLHGRTLNKLEVIFKSCCSLLKDNECSIVYCILRSCTAIKLVICSSTCTICSRQVDCDRCIAYT